MPKQVLPGSVNKTYVEQVKFVADLSQKGGAPYVVANLLDALTCLLLQCVRTGNRLFAENAPGKEYNLWGRVQEQTRDRRICIGAFSASGLSVGREYHFDNAYDISGVSVVRKF